MALTALGAAEVDALLDVDDALAVRVVLAAVERPEAALAADHRLAALGADDVGIRLQLLDGRDVAVPVQGQRARAVRPAVARGEPLTRLAREHLLHRVAA